MTRRTLIPTASLVAVIAAVGLLGAIRAEAEEPSMHVISSDVTARFVPLGLNKAVVIEMPADIKDVLVANPKVVNATVAQTGRRAYIVGVAAGETNIYFFDANARQIGALDIAVADVAQPDSPPLLENSALAVDVITMYRGSRLVVYRCTKQSCAPPPPTDDDKPAAQDQSKITDRDAKGNITGTRDIDRTVK